MSPFANGQVTTSTEFIQCMAGYGGKI